MSGVELVLRACMGADPSTRVIAVCTTDAQARYVTPEVAALTGKPVSVLTGGTAAWIDAGLATEIDKVRTTRRDGGRYVPNGSSGRATSPARLYSARIAASTAAISFS